MPHLFKNFAKNLEFLYTVYHFIIIIILPTYKEFLYTFNYYNNMKDTSLLRLGMVHVCTLKYW
jgi:hypothetical protein